MTMPGTPSMSDVDMIMLDPRKDDFYLGFRRYHPRYFFKLKNNTIGIQKDYYRDLEAFRFSGLDEDDPQYKVIGYILRREMSTNEDIQQMIITFNLEEILKTYLVAQAAGIKAVTSFLHPLAKKYEREIELMQY